MAGEFKGVVIGTVFMLLFFSTMLGFAIFGGEAYDKDMSEISGEKFNLEAMNETLIDIQTQAENWKDTLSEPSALKIVQELLSAIPKLLVTMWKILITPITLVIQLAENYLHLPPIASYGIIFIVGFTIIMAVIKVVKQGE